MTDGIIEEICRAFIAADRDLFEETYTEEWVPALVHRTGPAIRKAIENACVEVLDEAIVKLKTLRFDQGDRGKEFQAWNGALKAASMKIEQLKVSSKESKDGD